MKRVAVVIAHPDDEAIGCGATIRRLASTGSEVRVVLPLRRCDPRGVDRWTQLLDGLRRSCQTLGAEPVVIEPLTDEIRAETHPHEIHDSILPHVEWADTVFTHWPGDVNQVHRGVARAVEIATRPFRRRRNVYLFEIASSSDQVFGAAFSPTMHTVLGDAEIEAKCEAMSFYPTEAGPGRSPEALRRKAQVRGAEVGADFAEAFVVARHFAEI